MKTTKPPPRKDFKDDAFSGAYHTETGSFPFTVTREFIPINGELTYTGARIITLILEHRGTIVFKMIAYKEIFQVDRDDQEKFNIDKQIIKTISAAIYSRHKFPGVT